jgi:Rrf2 family transcriptional regulator, iron-sulfur cluster assembly transcription factor
MLSNTCKYAVRACIYLALNAHEDKKIGIKKIAEDLAIPTPFLGKIMQILAKNKILASTKGPNGGFCLAKPAKQISLMDIVNIIDGDGYFTTCVIGLSSCTNEEVHCAIHPKFAPIREQARQLFINQDIEELANSIRKNHHELVV